MKFLLLFVLIGLNAFFVAVEYAAIAARRSRLEMLVQRETAASRLVKEWLQNPNARDRLIAANQIYITLISLALGALGASAFEDILVPLFNKIHIPANWDLIIPILRVLPFILSLFIVTAFQVVLGEQVPKVTVLRSPEKFALSAAPIMRILNFIFRKFIDVTDWSAKQVLAWIGISVATTQTSQISVEELKLMVAGPEMDGVIEKDEQDMISAIFDFRDLTVRQVCVPRTEMVAVEENTSIDELVQLFSKENITKLPVFREDLDQVLGILYIRDLLAVVHNPGPRARVAGELVREALFVPETISVNDLLVQFKASRQHIAIVLDEYSGTTGLVTLEDLVEEIVGDYRDSFDVYAPQIQALSDGKALVDGLTLISEFNDHFGLEIRDAHYHTLAGYVLGKLERMPAIGDVVEDTENRLRFQVEGMARMRITQVIVSRLPDFNQPG
ncbi:MAG: hypothetical protein C0391_09225 [Anaerolinea sp.]|nr:hypothetical protein [Anaerolinea sp.]